ncbi:MAG: ABC transporter substrate-binding protein [Gammaproteobacteria bacterium]|nr:MAG: ABC transporter substrate-binding protein [Gammaproteobacteria bacterium]
MPKKTYFLPILLLGLFLYAPFSIATGPSPQAQLQATIDRILATLNVASKSDIVKKKQILMAIDQRFDYRAISRRTLATNWKKLNNAQRSRFVTAFSSLLKAAYYNKLKAYSGERVRIVSEKVEAKRAIIDTEVVSASQNIPIRYRMRLKNDQWLIYDVNVEGVSLVRNYRSSYRSIIDHEGFEGLMVRMEKKLASLQEQDAH